MSDLFLVHSAEISGQSVSTATNLWALPRTLGKSEASPGQTLPSFGDTSCMTMTMKRGQYCILNNFKQTEWRAMPRFASGTSRSRTAPSTRASTLLCGPNRAQTTKRPHSAPWSVPCIPPNTQGAYLRLDMVAIHRGAFILAHELGPPARRLPWNEAGCWPLTTTCVLYDLDVLFYKLALLLTSEQSSP